MDIYEDMGDLSRKHSDTHSSYGTRILPRKLKLEFQKKLNLWGKWMSERGVNPVCNVPSMDQYTCSC